MLKLVGSIVRNARLNLAMGVILIVTGLLETVDTSLEAFLGMDVGSHHGIIILGVVQVVKSLHDVLTGLEHVDRLNRLPD